jgi:leader peptidase (prepilin peptidase)/N-methyltransferase
LVVARAILRKPLAGDDRLPFGVFLAIGVWMTWQFGPVGLWR